MKFVFRLLNYILSVALVVFLLSRSESLTIGSIELNEQDPKVDSPLESIVEESSKDGEDSREKDNEELEASEEEEEENAVVKRVIDGDTLILEDDTRLRLIGVNTPEIFQKFGKEAKLRTEELVKDREVMLEYDKDRYDDYGRVLAYVYTDECFVNYELLKQGYAYLMIIPPNAKYLNEFKKAYKEAKDVKSGLWRK